ncbi:hypothetical protein H6F68_15715 [Trichocoleus sp. FACHB-262]|nr:hypothetical protein [Trichocoleus sp. FACHB-262]
MQCPDCQSTHVVKGGRRQRHTTMTQVHQLFVRLDAELEDAVSIVNESHH